MKIIAFNGSPRKEWNTAALLKKALEGAASAGAQTELIDLYDLNYRGCYSCFACKEKDGANYGKCPIKDDLLPIFKKIENADAIIFGSPIYFGKMSGEMHSFLERLLFQYFTYTDPPGSLFPKKIATGFIYTMGITEDVFPERGYDHDFINVAQYLTVVFGSSEMLMSFDAYQFKDYSKVFAPRFDVGKKLKRREEVFPIDCQKAFDMGIHLVKKSAV